MSTPTPERDAYRTMTAASVVLVAAIAAVVSYMHVMTLALRYGQDRAEAYLLPLSIDGLVAACGFVMTRAARADVSSPWLARTGLAVGVLATLACNAAYGLPHGWPGALLSGWPAVSFVIAAETAIMMTRRTAARPERARSHRRTPAEPAAVDAGQDETPRPRLAPVSGRARGPVVTMPPRPRLEHIQRVAGMVDPPVTGSKLAELTGRSPRTARRWLQQLELDPATAD